MLKKIPRILSPQLLKLLCEMGHGDTVVIADANFPAESMGKDTHVIRADGHSGTEILKAILEVLPLDTYVQHPVTLMEKVQGDIVETPIWKDYEEIITAFDSRGHSIIQNIERFTFYEKTRKAYIIVATGESALYGNIILQKGVI